MKTVLNKNSQQQKQQDEKQFRSVSFLVISLLLHALFLISFYTYNAFFKTDDAFVKETPKEPSIQFIDIASLSPQNRLVEQDENEKATKEKPLDAKFSSKVDKKVEKETRAAYHGEYQNKQAKEPQNQESQSQKSQASQSQPTEKQNRQPSPESVTAATTAPDSTEETMKVFDHGDVAVPKGEDKPKKAKKAVQISDLRPNTMQEMSESAMASVSQNNDYLKDVAVGAETQLNTREFLYYSYFNRVKKKLRQHWEPLVHAKVRLMMQKGREIASGSGAKSTRVIITLDERGTLTRVQVATTSGMEDLDDAAIEALKAAAQFPNPPKDLIHDGYVELNWDFILES